MKHQSFVFALSGTFFGLIVGWMLGSQQAAIGATAPAQSSAPIAAPAAAKVAGPIRNPSIPPPAQLDETREAELHAVADRDLSDVPSRVGLGNLHFDAGNFERAIGWYESALALAPNDVNVSTDLGVSYYYMGQVERALTQFQRSLEIDQNHEKTLLNMGIVRAYGAKDLNGAAAAWGKLIEIAPDTAEGRAAQASLERIAAAHAG
jgi:tetratricopeptide (TPR) repeat protein